MSDYSNKPDAATDLNEETLIEALMQMRRDPEGRISTKGTKLVITPDVIAHYGSLEAALEAAHRIMEDRCDGGA